MGGKEREWVKGGVQGGRMVKRVRRGGEGGGMKGACGKLGDDVKDEEEERMNVKRGDNRTWWW